MKKLIVVFSVVVFTAMAASAQEAKPANYSIAANIGLPTTSGLSLAYGVDVQADFPVAASTKITASLGYEGYSYKGISGSSGIIPLLGGVKFGLSDKLYGHAQLGYAISTVSGGGGAFAYAPSIGYYVSPNFDIAIKYLASSKNSYTTGSLNLRFAYNF